MKKHLLLLLSLCLTIPGFAQVNKTVIVEHFTNTLCSICASRNPGFRTNLANQPGVLLLTFHPSVPYSACIFNQHNKAENDARTTYYGILSGTPRLVIQGEVVSPGANYGSASIFTPYQGDSTVASIRIEQQKFGADSIEVRVWVKTEAEHGLGALSLFVGLAEDTIFYNAPNGESPHVNVFRKSLSGAVGQQIFLSGAVGDSVPFVGRTAMHPDWDAERIFTTVILQDEASKALIQAASVSPALNSPTAIEPEFSLSVQVYPNPAREQIQIEVSEPGPMQAKLYSLLGREIETFSFSGSHQLDLQRLSPGVYWIAFQNAAGQQTGRKFVKE